MAELFTELQKLATIDGRLVRLKKVLDSLPGELANQKKRLEAARAERDSVSEQIRQTASGVDGMSLEVKSNEQEIKDLDQKIGSVKNTKEYQIITGRVKELKQQIGEHEARELQMMEDLDKLKVVLKEKNDAVDVEELALEEKEEEMSEGVAEIKAEQQELAAQRSAQIAVIRGIDEEVLKIYSHAMRRGKGKGLAELKEDICQGCFRRVEPNIISAVRGRGKLENCLCAGCGRILYVEPVNEAAE